MAFPGTVFDGEDGVMKSYEVSFVPDNRKILVNYGTDLLTAASMAGIGLKSVCGGEGVCGKCAVFVRDGNVEIEGIVPSHLSEKGMVMACRTRVRGDVVVEVPEESRLQEHKVLLDRMEKGEILAEHEPDFGERYPLEPTSRVVALEMDPPSLTGNMSDLARLQTRLKKEIGIERVLTTLRALRRLPDAAREGNWNVSVALAEWECVHEILDVFPGGHPTTYGLAVDIGTTSVAVILADMHSGVTVDRAGTYNKQYRYGDDVISRIVHASDREGGLKELQDAVVDTINELIDKILGRNGIGREDVTAVSVAGNTTMTHLFLRIPPKFIRLEPYIPVASVFPVIKAREVGLNVHPEAPVTCFPAVASYVGGDIVAGVLYADIAHSDEISLFIDIGTNGEMVLGNRDWLVSCACSAGPCFEGGGITHGMRAMPGAIQRVEIDSRTFDVRLNVIGGVPPTGICGSGLVSALASLKAAGVIDMAGNFQEVPTDRWRMTDGGAEFILAREKESGTGREITISEVDVKNLLRAKGAVYAGVRSLLNYVQLPVEAIDRIFIAGGFGNYLNVRDSIEIGLLPDVSPEKYRFIGNSSVKGSRLALLSRKALDEAERLSRMMTYLELSVGTKFMEEFVAALFLPHTDLSQFPSVSGTQT